MKKLFRVWREFSTNRETFSQHSYSALHWGKQQAAVAACSLFTEIRKWTPGVEDVMFAHHFMYKWVLKPCPNREVTYWCEEETRGKPIYFCMCVSIGWNLKTERVFKKKKKKEAYLGFIGKLAPNTQRVSIKNAPTSWIVLAWPCGGGRHCHQYWWWSSLVWCSEHKTNGSLPFYLRSVLYLIYVGQVQQEYVIPHSSVPSRLWKMNTWSYLHNYSFFFMEVVKC